MGKRTRRNLSSSFKKARVVLAALAGEKTLAELAEYYGEHPNQITTWKRQLVEQAATVYGKDSTKETGPDIKILHAKIGQLTLENDFLEDALDKAGLLSAGRRGTRLPSDDQP